MFLFPKTPEQRIDEEIATIENSLLDMTISNQMTMKQIQNEERSLKIAVNRSDSIAAETHAGTIQSMNVLVRKNQQAMKELNHILIGLKSSKNTLSVGRATSSATRLYRGLNGMMGGERAMSMVGAYDQATEDWKVTSDVLHGALDSQINSTLDAEETKRIVEKAEEGAALTILTQLPAIPVHSDEPPVADKALVDLYSKGMTKHKRY